MQQPYDPNAYNQQQPYNPNQQQPYNPNQQQYQNPAYDPNQQYNAAMMPPAVAPVVSADTVQPTTATSADPSVQPASPIENNSTQAAAVEVTSAISPGTEIASQATVTDSSSSSAPVSSNIEMTTTASATVLANNSNPIPALNTRGVGEAVEQKTASVTNQEAPRSSESKAENGAFSVEHSLAVLSLPLLFHTAAKWLL